MGIAGRVHPTGSAACTSPARSRAAARPAPADRPPTAPSGWRSRQERRTGGPRQRPPRAARSGLPRSSRKAWEQCRARQSRAPPMRRARRKRRRPFSAQPSRATRNPAKSWLTGISSIRLMLRCGGRLAIQPMVSAMSSPVIGFTPR